MTIRHFFKQFRFARWTYFRYLYISHRVIGSLRLQSVKNKKELNLNLGCGATSVPNFVGADLYTGDVYLNLSKRFPFSNNSLDRIYMHHVLEHFDLNTAEKLCREIYRTLKVGGRIRIVVPDITLFINRNKFESGLKSEMEYYAGNTQKSLNYDNKYILALNEMFYMGGEHKFMYDQDFLSELLTNIGFKNIVRTEHGKSTDQTFNNIDPHQNTQISTISLCLEAIK